MLRYDGASGTSLGAFVASGSGGLHPPAGLAFGPDDNLYVASSITDQVLRYDGATGAFLDVLVAAGSGGLEGSQGAAGFVPRDVVVAGSFESTDAAVRKPAALCNPADVEDAGFVEPATHLESYTLRTATRAARQNGLAVSDGLGALVLDAVKPDRLRLPSAIDTNGPVAPPVDPPIDSYECYKARVSRGTPKLPRGTQLTVADSFEAARTLDVKKPSRLCVPAGIDGSAVLQPAALLTCYRVKPARGEPRHTRRANVHTANAFGAEQLDTVKEDELCLPASAAVP